MIRIFIYKHPQYFCGGFFRYRFVVFWRCKVHRYVAAALPYFFKRNDRPVGLCLIGRVCRVTQSISQEVSLLSLTHFFISYVFGYQKPIHSKLPPNREGVVCNSRPTIAVRLAHISRRKIIRPIDWHHIITSLLPFDSTYKHSTISCGQNLCILEDFCNFQIADKYSGPKIGFLLEQIL